MWTKIMINTGIIIHNNNRDGDNNILTPKLMSTDINYINHTF